MPNYAQLCVSKMDVHIEDFCVYNILFWSVMALSNDKDE